MKKQQEVGSDTDKEKKLKNQVSSLKTQLKQSKEQTKSVRQIVDEQDASIKAVLDVILDKMPQLLQHIKDKYELETRDEWDDRNYDPYEYKHYCSGCDKEKL